jgi:hypothetical protein
MWPSLLLALCPGAAAFELPAIAQLLAQPDTAVAGLSALTAAAVAGGAAARVGQGGGAKRAKRHLEAPYTAGPQTYDPRLADEFYAARPLLVGGRLARLGALTFAFNLKLLLDFLSYKAKGSPEGQPWPNEAARAKEALALSTKLGPTFIKLSQAISIRTDLIPEAYALELRQLQDAVPPFDSAEAMRILAYELGLPGGVQQLREIFPDISPQPIASASIGQVYRATTPDGRRVAVKVQRPGILSEIALDLHVLRLLAPVQTVVSNKINRLETRPRDLQLARELVDEWGRGFVAEADYKHEVCDAVGDVAGVEWGGCKCFASARMGRWQPLRRFRPSSHRLLPPPPPSPATRPCPRSASLPPIAGSIHHRLCTLLPHPTPSHAPQPPPFPLLCGLDPTPSPASSPPPPPSSIAGSIHHCFPHTRTPSASRRPLPHRHPSRPPSSQARSTTAFRTAMRERGLGAVTAPEVLPHLSTSKVLVTGWVDGTRLDRDVSPDVPRLCGVAINAYMTMLLDTVRQGAGD